MVVVEFACIRYRPLGRCFYAHFQEELKEHPPNAEEEVTTGDRRFPLEGPVAGFGCANGGCSYDRYARYVAVASSASTSSSDGLPSSL